MKNNLDSIQPKVCDSFAPFIEKYEFGKITDIKTGKKEIQFPHMLQADGIIDKNYKQSNVRILLFLKDSYRSKTDTTKDDYLYNLAAAYPALKTKGSCKNLSEWVKCIVRELVGVLQDNFERTALMNVSKLGHYDIQSSWSLLWAIAQKDKELLKNQFNSLNPNIIICGNTYDLFKYVMGVKDVEEVEVGNIANRGKLRKSPLTLYQWNERVIFDAYHPSLYNTKVEDFENLTKSYKDKIKQIINVGI